VAAAERALELAEEAAARFDGEQLVVHLSAALREYTAARAPRQAAMTCVELGNAYTYVLGNLTAGRAWFARARRLVADDEPCVEQGWVAVAAMGCDVDDPAELLSAAELALDRARRFGDVNLETKALADAGLAHVQLGDVACGMAMLDEAMALACGPADDLAAAARSVCSFFTACYHAADFERADAWTDPLRQHGLIGSSGSGPAFLAGHCDSVHATLLMELGRWTDAETVLEQARQQFERVAGMPSWHPDIALADLRVRQGRCADAEALLLGKDQSMQALLPAARLHLAHGDHELARVTARRGLRSLRDDQLRAVELLTTLVDVELAAGDLDAAASACGELTERADLLTVPSLGGRATAARARALAAEGCDGEAIELLEAAVDDLDPRRLPWLRVTLLLDLARLRLRCGDRAGARVDARAAQAALDALDVALTPADAELLAELAEDTSHRSVPTAALTWDGRRWTATAKGTSVRLADTKGLRYLAELIRNPGVERHALDLVDQVEGIDPNIDRRALGDAGPLSDGRARAAYRRRIEDLRADVEEQLAAGQLDAAEATQVELDQLVVQLAAAFGLGGRDRRAGSAVERARVNVTRAVRAAIGKVGDALPEAGGVLDRRVRTGTYCAYEPDPVDEVRWIVQREVNTSRQH
jgi:tetratricopeptide (TPR) repeat protein